ncbi:MAG: SGNH/GDSL hydrolase family protein [Alistipes sp.]|jgi:lysophospholipase L1-like esterase|nr:SGNH/GDSL hydrolase family protein [Alistipes sp.]MBQ5620402.1 SGNH/GDSL hydrolase family protein [Alistipes sp.]MBQ5654255.1 SGNH/GDSL hydrolase family protein [Alistipes sp.]
MMRKLFALVLAVAVVMPLTVEAKKKQEEPKQLTIQNQWYGKRVAYLGDSITDERQTTTQKVYWQYLEELLGIVPTVYGISGNQWHQIIPQAERMIAKQGQEVDAILIFMGTNDFNAGVPLGAWYEEKPVNLQVHPDGTQEYRWQRTPIMDDSTVRGRINKAMTFLKEHYPTKQIIVLTPIHRAIFRSRNGRIQPDELYSNKVGLFLSDYLEVYQEIANVWAVPVIDLNSICGLYPVMDVHAPYFRSSENDRLHPNSDGQYRMAKALMYQLLAHPADFE